MGAINKKRNIPFLVNTYMASAKITKGALSSCSSGYSKESMDLKCGYKKELFFIIIKNSS